MQSFIRIILKTKVDFRLQKEAYVENDLNQPIAGQELNQCCFVFFLNDLLRVKESFILGEEGFK